MNKCEIVRDLIPLCIDKVASESSELMVNEHIESCPECKRMMDDMSNSLEIPISTQDRLDDVEPFYKMRKSIVSKFIKTVAIAVTVIAIMIVGTQVINHRVYTVDPNDLRFYVEDSKLMMEYMGKGDISFSAGGAEMQGDQKASWEIEIFQSFWDKYISPLYDHSSHVYYISDSENIKELYDFNGNLLWENK